LGSPFNTREKQRKKNGTQSVHKVNTKIIPEDEEREKGTFIYCWWECKLF
jgi:hypothetical protein